MKRTAFLGCSLLTIALVIPVHGRASQAAQGLSIDDSYTIFYGEPDIAKKNALAEQFLKDYKNSTDPSAEGYREGVYKTLLQNYTKANDFAKLMDVADRTEQLVPAAPPKVKASGYQQGMIAAQQSNNIPKTLSFGDKVLVIIPDDLNTLITLSSTIPAALPTDAAGQSAALSKADQYASTALGIVAKLDPATVGLSAADWAKQRPGIEGTLHTTLGGNAYTRMNYVKAIEELTLATKATPKNDLAWYQMGLALSQQAIALSKKVQDGYAEANKMVAAHADHADIDEKKAINEGMADAYRAKLQEAIDALATAVACAGPNQAPARAQLEKLWGQKNNGSKEGIDAFINSKKQP